MLIVPLALALSAPAAATSNGAVRHRSIVQDRARRSLRPSLLCCWCSASSPAASSSPSSPCICRPILVDRGLPPRRPAAGCLRPSASSTSSVRSASAMCRTTFPKRLHPCRRSTASPDALSILVFISFPVTTFSSDRVQRDLSGLTWLSTVPADLGAGGADVRHAGLPRSTASPLSATRSAASSASGSAAASCSKIRLYADLVAGDPVRRCCRR